MPQLPILNSRELIVALEKAGFATIRQRGSHVRLQHAAECVNRNETPKLIN
jgi:predicted RNA binding protein YcfA (HicA-like mRNA interferase family)